MKDGLVNWSKMRQIARHCAIVTDCSRVTTEYLHDDNLSRLVTDLPVYSLDSDVRANLPSFLDLAEFYAPNSLYTIYLTPTNLVKHAMQATTQSKRRPGSSGNLSTR
jgi:hypothetical protein